MSRFAWLTVLLSLSCRAESQPIPVPSTTTPSPVMDPPGTRVSDPSEADLIFFSDRSGNGDIYLHDFSAGKDTLLIGGPASQFGPRWLPEVGELRWLAEGEDGVHLFAGTPSDMRDLGPSPAGDVTPAWSRDGQSLIYPAPHRGGARLTVRRGANTRTLQDFPLPVAELAVSPDDRMIVFAAGPDGARDLYIVGWDPKAFEFVPPSRLLTNTEASEGHPSFSPDGRFVVFDRSPEFGVADIWEVELASGHEKQLTCDPGAELVGRVSPSGADLVFGSNRDGQWDVYRTPRGACAPQRVSHADGFDGDGSWR